MPEFSTPNGTRHLPRTADEVWSTQTDEERETVIRDLPITLADLHLLVEALDVWGRSRTNTPKGYDTLDFAAAMLIDELVELVDPTPGPDEDPTVQPNQPWVTG